MSQGSTGASLQLPPGYQLCSYGLLTSSNDEATALAAAGAADGTIVWARAQSAARGRQGRRWSSQPGNLFCSWILRPQTAPDKAAQLGFAAALAVGDTAADLLPPGQAIGYKWPNDVLVNGGKLSGILLESRMAEGGGLDWLVLGIGVNVLNAPEIADYPTASLRSAGARPALNVEAVLEDLTQHFASWRQRWQASGFAALREPWLKQAVGLNQPIELRLPQETLRGTFRDLDEEGALVLELPDRSLKKLSAGEVHLLT